MKKASDTPFILRQAQDERATGTVHLIDEKGDLTRSSSEIHPFLDNSLVPPYTEKYS